MTAEETPTRNSGRSSPRFLAGVLAVMVHLALIGFLVFGVRWQNKPPLPVTAELYAPPAPTPVEPTPEPPPPQAKEPAPPPPKPAVKPEPPKPTKAEIALKEKQEKERLRKEEEEREKEKRQREAEQKKQEQMKLAKIREAQAREAEALQQQAARERNAEKKAAEAARAKAFADYIQRISAKIRGNIILPPNIPGNPEAVFEVVQLPTGEIISAELKKSSGYGPYDDAVQRAILKSSPLPKPETTDLFQRALTLKFRPLE